MRLYLLYLLDLPEGMSARVVGIAIVAPEQGFGHVAEAAASTLDSFEFHAPRRRPPSRDPIEA